MRKLDTNILNVCWDYVNTVGIGKDPYVKLVYRDGQSIFECFKDGGATESTKQRVGIVSVTKRGYVSIHPNSDNNFVSYFVRELGRKKVEVFDNDGVPIQK